MRNERMINGSVTRPIVNDHDRMILSTQNGGMLTTRDRRLASRKEPLELDTNDD